MKSSYHGESKCSHYLFSHFSEDLLQHQQADLVLRQLHDALSHSSTRPTGPMWKQSPFNCYRQLWPQLTLKEGLVCHQYTPGPTMEAITVPLIPSALQSNLISQYHDAPRAAHLGPGKTAAKVRHVGYWVWMLYDTDQYYCNCSVCQASKTPSPVNAPLVYIPIGKPWEMIDCCQCSGSPGVVPQQQILVGHPGLIYQLG